jgi:glycosyltransferase involved in cell wall biosynthesis
VIYLVCQVFYPDPQSTSQLLSDVIRELAGRGHAITVLSGFPGMKTAGALESREVWNGVVIERGGLRGSFKRSLWRRAVAYASYCLFVTRRLLTIPSGARVLVVTNPPFAPVLAWLVCTVRGHRFSALLQDIYPEGLAAVGRLKKGGLVDRLWHTLNRRALAAADHVWVLGRDMAKMVEDRYAVPARKVRTVPHWSPIEFETITPAESTELWHRQGLAGKFVVQYSGNMGLWHDLDTIVQAAALLRERPEIHFLFVGAGMKRAPAEALAHSLGLANVSWLPYQDRKDLPDSLACCHVALISQLAGLEGIAVPCKLYGILASGRAVVAQVPDPAEVALVVREEDCGIVVPPSDARALAGAIARLADDRALTLRQGQNAFAAYLAKYTLKRATEDFNAIWVEWGCVSMPRATGGPAQPLPR